MKKTLLIFIFVITGLISSSSVTEAKTLTVGSSGSEIRILQSELRTLHYPTGPVDGVYGSITKAAVRKFQRHAHLRADGIVGSQTQQALKKADHFAQRRPKQIKSTQLINYAQRFLGIHYVWGGTTPAGFDCSGYTRYVFAREGITLPRLAIEQYRVGTPVSFKHLRPNDLVFFKLSSRERVSHVGIYLGHGKFISATTHKGIAIYGFTPYWARAYVGAKRV